MLWPRRLNRRGFVAALVAILAALRTNAGNPDAGAYPLRVEPATLREGSGPTPKTCCTDVAQFAKASKKT